MKIVFIIFLLILPSVALCDWTYTSTSMGIVDNYVDLSTKVKTDNMLYKIWTKQEYRVKSEKGWLSAKALMETNCTKRQSRFLAIIAYDKKNLVGNVLDSQKDTGEWIDIERGSIGEKFLKAIC